MQKNTKKPHSHEKDMANISKTMCYLLRHQAKQHGLNIESSGFVNLEELLEAKPLKKFKLSKDTVFEIVKNDQKGRYQIENRPPYFIRAVQGHSIKEVKDEDILDPITNIFQYPVVVHGTYLEAWEKIKETGLNRMTRNCIHFSIGHKKEDHVISGMRNNCEVFIELNAIQAFYNDILFFISKNKVVLSSGTDGVIHPKYFKKVTGKSGNVLFAQDYSIGIYFQFEKLDEDAIFGTYSALNLSSNEKEVIRSDKIKDFDDLNKIPEFLINTCKDLITKPFIILIDKPFEENYVNLIQSRQGEIDNLAFYSDYMTIEDSSKLKEESNFNASRIKRIDLDFKRHYEKINEAEIIDIEKKALTSTDNNNQIKSNAHVISDFKLSKKILLDKSITKNYLLLFLNYEEEDILISIDYILIPDGNLEAYKNFQFKLETKPVKENLNNFLEQLKQNLINEKVYDKILILCTNREDLNYLNSLMKKNSIKAPKLFQRNVILLYPSDFSTLESNEYKYAVEIFLIQYVLDDSTVEKIKILH